MIRVWRHFWNIAILGEKQILSAKIKTPSGAPLRAGQTFLEPDTQVSVFLKTKTPERIILFFSQRISCFTLRDPTSDHKCNILERYFFYQKKYGPEFIQIYLHFYLYTRINTKKEKNSKKNQKKIFKKNFEIFRLSERKNRHTPTDNKTKKKLSLRSNIQQRK